MKRVSKQELEALRNSSLFDPKYYLEQYPDVKMLGMDPLEHYLWLGARIGRDPSPEFSSKGYLALHADVAEAGANPLRHYVFQGKKEGRQLATRAPREPWSPAPVEYVAKTKAAPLEDKPARVIAFYLPQFHPIPENDAWWGRGFTEWTNVRPAEPQFRGHYQPHVPHPDLGYYDLRSKDAQRSQIELAKLYGIEAFCFYYYRFNGKRLLDKPIENYLQDASLDFPFCLCWANENWTRRWDGLESDILIAQDHSSEDDLGCIADLARYMQDPRYIRINGKPLLLVYRPSLLPSAIETAERWRRWCRENGIGEIYLAYTQSFEKVDPIEIGFDAAIEFPPNNSAPVDITDSVERLGDGYTGKVYDWKALADRSNAYVDPEYKLFRSVCPGWDNTARRKQNGTVFVNNTPALYQSWLENAVKDTVCRFPSADERLVFVNAWNEWAEGAHLEPDTAAGYAYLQATRNALERTSGALRPQSNRLVIVSHDAHPHGAQYLALNMARTCVEEFGYEVDLVVLGDGPLKGEFARYAKVHDLAGIDPAGVEARDLVRSLRNQGASAAICNTTVSGTFVPTLKESGFTVVSLIHELPELIRQYGLESSAGVIAEQADRVVFAADAVAEGFERFASVPQEKSVIRPQGLYKVNHLRRQPRGIAAARAELRRRYEIEPDAPIVLAVGYADRRKGVDLFIDAGVKLLDRRPDARFIWLGKEAEPDWMEQAKSAAMRAGVMDRFIFPGLQENTDIYYAGSDLYALTSREDPYPSVVLEAMDCGLPVVAFAGTGGMASLIDEAGGRNVPAFDTDAFASAMDQIIAGESPADPSARGQDIIDRRYSFRQYVHDLLVLGGEDKPRVSVIVPNYNYAAYIESRLQSICDQTMPIYELIVLDDASSDDSARRIGAFLANCKIPSNLVVNGQNSGSVSRQWLRGVEMARGDFVWIAEADDLADPDFLAEVLPAFSRPDVVLSYCQSRQIDDAGTILCEHYLDYVADIDPDRWKQPYIADGREEIATALYLKNTIPNVSGVVFRREALLETLLAHKQEIMSYRNAGDWVTYVRLLERGAVAFSPRSLNSHRRHQTSVTVGNFNLPHLREIAKVQNEMLARHRLNDDASAKAANYVRKLAKQFRVSADEIEHI